MVQANDLRAIQSILNAIEIDKKIIKYSVIVNQYSEEAYEEFFKSGDIESNLATAKEYINCGKFYTNHIHFEKNVPKNWSPSNELIKFIEDAPEVLIKPEEVIPIKNDVIENEIVRKELEEKKKQKK